MEAQERSRRIGMVEVDHVTSAGFRPCYDVGGVLRARSYKY